MTAKWVPTWSFSSRASMLVKPNTAFTGLPSGRVIGGSAWNARKMNPEPSIRTRCSGVSPGISAGAGPRDVPGISPGGSMSAVASSFIQDVEAGAIGAHHLLLLNIKEHAGMAQRTAIAGDGTVVDVKSLRGEGG